MERELFNKAYHLVEAIEASWSIRLWIVDEAYKEGSSSNFILSQNMTKNSVKN